VVGVMDLGKPWAVFADSRLANLLINGVKLEYTHWIRICFVDS
jgi:hypothetical protein